MSEEFICWTRSQRIMSVWILQRNREFRADLELIWRAVKMVQFNDSWLWQPRQPKLAGFPFPMRCEHRKEAEIHSQFRENHSTMKSNWWQSYEVHRHAMSVSRTFHLVSESYRKWLWSLIDTVTVCLVFPDHTYWWPDNMDYAKIGWNILRLAWMIITDHKLDSNHWWLDNMASHTCEANFAFGLSSNGPSGWHWFETVKSRFRLCPPPCICQNVKRWITFSIAHFHSSYCTMFIRTQRRFWF
jgi:hypothetical protein